MNAPGRRTFVAATIALLLLGGVHLLAVYKGNFVSPVEPREIEVDRAMRSLTYDIGPFHTNGHMLVQLLSASFSVLLLGLGALNLIMLPAAIAHGRLRALTIANLVIAVMLLALTVIYQFPPPMVFALVAAALFVASFIRQRAKPLAA